MRVVDRTKIAADLLGKLALFVNGPVVEGSGATCLATPARYACLIGACMRGVVPVGRTLSTLVS